MGLQEEKMRLMRKYRDEIKTTPEFFVAGDVSDIAGLVTGRLAIEEYIPEICSHKIIGFYDKTLFCTGKAGFVFTDIGVYHYEKHDIVNGFFYDNINSMELLKADKKDDCDRILKIYTKNGTTQELSSTLLNKTPLKNFLEEMIQLNKKESKQPIGNSDTVIIEPTVIKPNKSIINMRKDRIELLRKYRNEMKTREEFYVAEEIPIATGYMAIKEFMPELYSQEIIGFYDKSLWKTGSSAFVFTDCGIYSYEQFKKDFELLYDDIQFIELLKINKKKDTDKLLKFRKKDGTTKQLFDHTLNKTPLKAFLEEMMLLNAQAAEQGELRIESLEMKRVKAAVALQEEKINLMEKYRDKIKTSGEFYSTWEIPDMVNNLIKKIYIPEFGSQAMLGYYDITFFNSGKEGFVFANQGLYYFKEFKELDFLFYDEIQSMELLKIEKKDCNRILKVYKKDGTAEEWASIWMNKTPLKDFLEEMILLNTREREMAEENVNAGEDSASAVNEEKGNPSKIWTGIDFGTSMTMLQTLIDDERQAGSTDCRPIRFTQAAKAATPSLVRIIEEKNVFQFGEEAEYGKHGKMFSEFKLGLKAEDEDILARGIALTEKYFQYLYQYYKEECVKLYPEVLHLEEETVVGFPVQWDEKQREIILNAAIKAGFQNVKGTDEATAAIICALTHKQELLKQNNLLCQDKPLHIMVLDMGAGTTDLAFAEVSMKENMIHTSIRGVWPPKESTLILGGSHFDHRLENMILQWLNESGCGNISANIIEDNRLAIKRWKEANVSIDLANNMTTDYCTAIENIVKHIPGFKQLAFPKIDRVAFETLIEPELRVFAELINTAPEEWRKETELVILTGGNSQWYWIPEYLSGQNQSDIKIDLPKIADEPWRIQQLSFPTEVVSRGLIYNPNKIQFDDIN